MFGTCWERHGNMLIHFGWLKLVETVETHHLLSPSPKNAAQLAS
jgi:hypothetical protein